jgi:hypothetical protein
MRTKRSSTRDALRLAIDSLPRQTRVAMLAGLDANTIIVGAYTTGDGICPMLAAHRCGGRTSTVAFANAWDRFASGGSRRCGRRIEPRPASEHELSILRSYLDTSLLIEDAARSALTDAHRDHLQLVARRRGAATAAASAGRESSDADRSRQVGQRPGWAWSAVVRGVGDYERVLRLVQAELGSAEEGRVLEPVDPRASEPAAAPAPQALHAS